MKNNHDKTEGVIASSSATCYAASSTARLVIEGKIVTAQEMVRYFMELPAFDRLSLLVDLMAANNAEMRQPESEALARWMQEVTDMLIYSPENPMDYKTGVVEAFAQYRKAIGKPLKPNAA